MHPLYNHLCHPRFVARKIIKITEPNKYIVNRHVELIPQT